MPAHAHTHTHTQTCTRTHTELSDNRRLEHSFTTTGTRAHTHTHTHTQATHPPHQTLHKVTTPEQVARGTADPCSCFRHAQPWRVLHDAARGARDSARDDPDVPACDQDARAHHQTETQVCVHHTRTDRHTHTLLLFPRAIKTLAHIIRDIGVRLPHTHTDRHTYALLAFPAGHQGDGARHQRQVCVHHTRTDRQTHARTLGVPARHQDAGTKDRYACTTHAQPASPRPTLKVHVAYARSHPHPCISAPHPLT